MRRARAFIVLLIALFAFGSLPVMAVEADDVSPRVLVVDASDMGDVADELRHLHDGAVRTPMIHVVAYQATYRPAATVLGAGRAPVPPHRPPD